VPLERGAVYLLPTLVTARGGGGSAVVNKYQVVLQDPASMDARASNYAFVLASTDRSNGRGARLFEVLLDEEDGFDHGTMVDGRWVYTQPRDELDESGYQFTLSEERMDDISLAVFEGLQLTP
jgi:hypothetical protein